MELTEVIDKISKLYREERKRIDNIYIDGYELVNNKWKKTLRALWYKWF